MIQDLKSYPETRDSGVPWLGAIPRHWGLEPAFAAYSPKLVKNTGMIENSVLSLSYGRIVVKPVDKLHGLVPESFETYQIVDPGNIIVRTTDLQNDQTSLRVGISHYRGIITSAYLCLNVRKPISEEFGFLVLNAYDLLKVLYGFGSGLRQNLDFSHIKRMPVPVPPLDEQAAIVRFLDYADRRIRSYIRAKQKLIKLLEEQKQAIIHQAVTRGLDPNVRLKPSGVEWLGDVPDHWRVSRVKNEFHCLNYRRVPLSGTKRGEMTSRLYDYYGASGVIDKVDDFLFDDDLLLIAEDGANLVLRNLPLAIIASGKFWVNNHAHILKPIRGNLQYLASVMETLSYKPWISGAAQPKLTKDRLMGIVIAVPALEEQKRIMESVNEETSSLRSALDRAQRGLSLLRQYRTRLVADVVTGKLDVRQASNQLPEEIEETAIPSRSEELTGEDEEEIEAKLEEAAEEAEA